MPDRTLLDAMAVRIIAALRDPVRGRWNGHHGFDDQEEPIPADRESAVA
jgi:hypothetical protein